MTDRHAPQVAVVILTWNRRDEVLRTIAHTLLLPEAPPVVVVDNGSGDGTAKAVALAFPQVRLIALPRNIGAAARNHGALAATADYVAFSDDDTLWCPGSLRAAADLLAAHPRIGVLCARVTVAPSGRIDPACREMAGSPLPSEGLPGRAVIGFMAGACVFRRSAFLASGGYEPRLFIGSEETLLSLDLCAGGWQLVYCETVDVVHHPSPLRDGRRRRRLVVRNRLWVALMRRPWSSVGRIVLDALKRSAVDADVRAGLVEAVMGAPWALARRQVVPAALEAACRLVEAVPPVEDANVLDGQDMADRARG